MLEDQFQSVNITHLRKMVKKNLDENVRCCKFDEDLTGEIYPVGPKEVVEEEPV